MAAVDWLHTSSMSLDEDFQFLKPDPRKLAEEQNQAFDGKKMCWIPDQKEGYIKAEIISTKGEDVTVSTDNQDVSFFHSKSLTKSGIKRIKV